MVITIVQRCSTLEKNEQYCQQVVFINKKNIIKIKTYKFVLFSRNRMNLIMNRTALF